MAYRVRGDKRDDVIAYLRERELVTEVYRESWRAIRLEGPEPRTETALAYLADPTHEQYAGKLSREALLARVRDGVGRSGVNADYVINTARHLRELGFGDPILDWLEAELTRRD
jgi:cation transport protein ChaC